MGKSMKTMSNTVHAELQRAGLDEMIRLAASLMRAAGVCFGSQGTVKDAAYDFARRVIGTDCSCKRSCYAVAVREHVEASVRHGSLRVYPDAVVLPRQLESGLHREDACEDVWSFDGESDSALRFPFLAAVGLSDFLFPPVGCVVQAPLVVLGRFSGRERLMALTRLLWRLDVRERGATIPVEPSPAFSVPLGASGDQNRETMVLRAERLEQVADLDLVDRIMRAAS